MDDWFLYLVGIVVAVLGLVLVIGMYNYISSLAPTLASAG